VTLQSLVTRNFRNLVDDEIGFHPSVNIIVGDNGQGKSNLLEAIYFLATTKSFRTPRTANLTRIGSETLFVRGSIADRGLERSVSVGVAAGDFQRRELLVNGQKVTLPAFLQQIPLVAYSAARLEIVRGSPEEGRRFLDRGIAGIQPGYLEHLGRYSRVVRQRNALLGEISRGEARATLLDPWDQEMVAAAEPVVTARAEYATAILEEFRTILAAHHYHVTDLDIRYVPHHFEPGKKASQENLRRLREVRARELRLGYSLIGPQRDVLELNIHGRSAADVLSSGELKMTVLFLKFAKMSLQRRELGQPPMFLLDDVDAELDLGIIERLLGYLVGTSQIFVTSAKQSVLESLVLADHATIQLTGGAVFPRPGGRAERAGKESEKEG